MRVVRNQDYIEVRLTVDETEELITTGGYAHNLFELLAAATNDDEVNTCWEGSLLNIPKDLFTVETNNKTLARLIKECKRLQSVEANHCETHVRNAQEATNNHDREYEQRSYSWSAGYVAAMQIVLGFLIEQTEKRP